MCLLDSIPWGSTSKLLYMLRIVFLKYRSQFIPHSSFPTWRLVTTSLLTYVQCNLEGINIIGSIIVVRKTIMVDDYNDKGGVTPPCMYAFEIRSELF